MEVESLKNKTVKGAGWSLLDTLSNQGVTFLVGIILARLLSPEEYGLIGIVMIFIAVFNSIVDSGFSNALIRKHNTSNKDYSTVFYTNLVISIVLVVVLYVTAPSISCFFNKAELTQLLRVMSVCVVFNALSITQRTILTKKIAFQKLTYVSILSSTSSGIVGILMAYAGYGVWSLISQQVVRQFLNMVLLWLFNKWLPRLEFSTNSFKELWSFGWKLLASGLIGTFWTQIYQVVIGRYYTTIILGQFTRASQFSQIFSQNLTGVVQRVTYPVLSSIKDDLPRLKSSYKRVIKQTMFISFVCMFSMIGSADNIVLFFVGSKWDACIPMLRIICLYMMFYPVSAINLNMLQVQGRSDIFLKLEILKKIIAILPLYMGIFKGLYWMLWASVLTDIISYILNAFFSGKQINYSVTSQIKDILPSFVFASILGIVLFVVGTIGLSCYYLFPIQIIVAIVYVIVIGRVVKLEEYLEIQHLFNTLILKHKKRHD